ncbi:MAG: Gfo/Idh/MocA family oxidoreductase [Candidatus Hydrogenedentes bacterium]|nr:Gfo/Idh/MocA family oxidoreductase [Candidatus Hydrogenedentota bacterium]
MSDGVLSRRRFLGVSAASLAAAGSARAASDAVRVGVIGCGARGFALMQAMRGCAGVRVAAACDVYAPRRRRARAAFGVETPRHWQDLVARNGLDAVVIATPDHWHATMAVGAMEAGKDVYCERPMALTVREANAFRDCALRTGRVVQIGAQQTVQPQWQVARELVDAGAIGQVLWSQGSYRRDTGTGGWNRPIEAGVSPDSLDWEGFLGPAPRRPFSPERFFRWRKYWDYSGGLAADLHYGNLAPLVIAVGAGHPERVSAAGGVYVQDGREAPDTFVMTAEYAAGHTIVLASSAANQVDLPAVIRGREATIYLEGSRVRVVADGACGEGAAGRLDGYAVPAGPRRGGRDDTARHVADWLDCIRRRAKCVCNEEVGYRAMVAVGMAIDAFRQGKTLYFDAGTRRVMASPSRVCA